MSTKMISQSIPDPTPPAAILLRFPEGYRATGEFRAPKKGEYFIQDGNTVTTRPLCADWTYPDVVKRYILVRTKVDKTFTKYINVYPDTKGTLSTVHNFPFETLRGAERSRAPGGVTAVLTYSMEVGM